jgi:PAS domain S-box-containing protein
VVVLVLTVVGFFVARAVGELDVRRESTHRADIAAIQVRDRVVQATTLMDAVRRFLAAQGNPGVTTTQFADVGASWLAPLGLPAAGWIEDVPARERASYERRAGHRIVSPTSSGGLAPAGRRTAYLPATLVTGNPPMSAPGVDLGRIPGVEAAVARPQTAYRATATPLTQLPDGGSGLFLVQSAQRLRRGNVEPGFVVFFLPASWLLSGAADAVGPNSGLQITVGGGSAGDLGDVPTARNTFTAAGQRFEVEVPRRGDQGAAEVLPWIVAAAGLLLAALAGALGVNAARRAKARAEVDRLFTLSSDLIVVAGFDGYYKRVNPAFEARTGYTEEEALSRPYVEFVHPDDRERTEARRQALVAGTVTLSFENRYVCKDGSTRWIEWTATPVLDERLTYAVGRDVTERRQGEMDLRAAEERNRALAEEQAALRRVATLVAERTPPRELFAAVTEEVGQLLPVTNAAMGRYEPDGLFTTVAAWSVGAVAFPVGRRWVPEGKNVMTIVFETGRPARLDDFADASGAVGEAAREAGYRSAVGTPIMVEGCLWGVMTAASTVEQLPSDTEARLASFTELVATAIANAESRAELTRLANEQAALRRVATLVAEAVPPERVFSTLCEEVKLLLDAQTCVIVRLEPDGMVVVVASAGATTPMLALGTHLTPEPGWVLTAALQSGRPSRKDDYAEDNSDGMPRAIRGLGIQSSVAAPIVVEGALWGVIVIGTERLRFPDGTELRLQEFTALAATAIANAESRSELAASRVRIVAASDDTRRRIERDLHDGTQQRLVSLSLQLRLAESKLSPELEDARATIGRAAGELNEVIEELREISRGIHPAILTEGGLGPALRTLARRSAIPVDLDAVVEDRLPGAVEVAAYYVVSEAVTNAAKHANASGVDVQAAVRDGCLRLSICDDGVGGADTAAGSGLLGLRDRVEALGGSIEISSPPGHGTQLVVELPLGSDLCVDAPQELGAPLEDAHVVKRE